MRSQTDQSNTATRNLRREKRLWHDEKRNMPSLGCHSCREYKLCGGLRLSTAFFDCLQFCCGNTHACDRVCRKHPDFVDYVREINTFSFDNIPQNALVPAPALPRVVPIVFHGNRREKHFSPQAVALPLARMFVKQNGEPRFHQHKELCDAFQIAEGVPIILSGTDRDRPLERWWEMGEKARSKVIVSLKEIGVNLVTTPNYSLFIDRPRWDDLHAMKRIAILHAEFLAQGLPSALHVNGRTDTDFQRWADFIVKHPEVTHIAYEFTTGTGWASRREQHLLWLKKLALDVGRPLHLLVRGGRTILSDLATSFSQLTFLDTSIFLKTMKRQKALRIGNADIRWDTSLTPDGEPLDQFLEENYATVAPWLADLASPVVCDTNN